MPQARGDPRPKVHALVHTFRASSSGTTSACHSPGRWSRPAPHAHTREIQEGRDVIMESTAPRATRAQSTERRLTGWVTWRFLTVAVAAGAAVIVWALPLAHRAVESPAELPVSGDQTPPSP